MILMEIFREIFNCIRDDKEYYQLPPKGPAEDLPSLSNEELAAMMTTVFGTDQDFNQYSYYSLKLVENEYRPIYVKIPDTDLITQFDLYGIDGSNQRLEHPAFFVILARSALVRFRYCNERTTNDVYSIQKKDLSGIVLVDGNIFSDDLELYVEKQQTTPDGSVDVLRYIREGKKSPILTRYNPDRDIKVPSSQALGFGVRYQQTLELAMLEHIPLDRKAIVIRDGPLFSTSVSPGETKDGLNKTYQWKDQVLVSVSKRIGESSLITELLLKLTQLRDAWFPGQLINDATLKKLASDQLILSRILKPGYRTPLIEAVGRARRSIVEEQEDLAPLACYYMSRQKPNTIIRMEIPRFMWERNKDLVNIAISFVAWQLDLGLKAPYIQLVADEQSQLKSEITSLRYQASAKLYEKNLIFPEVFL
jgi:hypothetical protein